MWETKAVDCEWVPQAKQQGGPKGRKFANIFSCRLHNYDDFVNIYATEMLFCLRFKLLDSPFASEEQKKVHDVTNASAPHAGRVHDIADTDCQAQNGSVHGHFLEFQTL